MNVEAEAQASAARCTSLSKIKSQFHDDRNKRLVELAYQMGFCDGILSATEELTGKIVDLKEEILFRSNLRDSQ